MFASSDLSEYDVAYLFVDGIAERIRPGQRREPVLAAWGFSATGSRVLLHLMAGSKEDLMAGSKEDSETVSAFFQDMRARLNRSAVSSDRRHQKIPAGRASFHLRNHQDGGIRKPQALQVYFRTIQLR